MAKQGKSSKKIMRIKDALTVVNAQELKDKFLSTLDKTDYLELDLSQVEETDTAGFQLLVFLKKEAETQGKTFSISTYSPSVVSVLKLYNMLEYFNIDDAALSIPDDNEDAEQE